MARIRSIKPEFWTSAQVMECSPIARLLFVGIWNFCDDAGRFPLSPKQLRALIFPGDEIPFDDIRRMIDELSSNDLIRMYVVDGKEYFFVTGWKHQKIDKPQPAKYPEPSPPILDRTESSRDHSSNGIDGEDKRGREGIPVGPAEPAKANGSENPEAELYARGKKLLGPKSGGLITALKKAKNGSVIKALAIIIEASEKQDPREYIAAVIEKRSRDSPDPRGTYGVDYG